MGVHSLIHLNHNLLCAIDLETTGLTPAFHEIVQMAFVPLDAKLEPSREYPVFDVLLKPNHPERANSEARRIITKAKLASAVRSGFDQVAAFDLWEQWFQKLCLPEKRRIVPLGHNYAYFDAIMLREWMGNENYSHYMDSRTRDTYLIAEHMNDRADFNSEQTPFPRLSLSFLASKLGIEVDPGSTHDAFYDACLSARIYKKMVKDITL